MRHKELVTLAPKAALPWNNASFCRGTFCRLVSRNGYTRKKLLNSCWWTAL